MKDHARIVAAAVTLALPLVAAAAEKEKPIGQLEYERNCATCHGLEGKGDGPFAEFLKEGAPPLTGLSKGNDGVFPFERVHAYIDGREWTAGHGSREMPVWGAQYTEESVQAHGPFFGEWYGEEVVQARILALVEYISTLQE